MRLAWRPSSLERQSWAKRSASRQRPSGLSLTGQAKIVADQWISYLRHGLSTCYYCVASTPFPEELHRKCIGHVRPDSSVKTDIEQTAAEDDTKPVAADEDTDPRYNEEGEGRPREQSRSKFPQRTADEKWETNLDYKLKPLLEEVDMIEYGGRDLLE